MQLSGYLCCCGDTNRTAKRPTDQSHLGLQRSECRAAKIKQLNKQWFISEVHGDDERQQPCVAAGEVPCGCEEHTPWENGCSASSPGGHSVVTGQGLGDLTQR